jgi:hypothetical protein
MSAAQSITALMPDQTLADRAMAQSCENYRAAEMHVLIRFGKWSEILQRAPPEDPQVIMIYHLL